jgi:hypothetical protein
LIKIQQFDVGFAVDDRAQIEAVNNWHSRSDNASLLTSLSDPSLWGMSEGATVIRRAIYKSLHQPISLPLPSAHNSAKGD